MDVPYLPSLPITVAHHPDSLELAPGQSLGTDLNAVSLWLVGINGD